MHFSKLAYFVEFPLVIGFSVLFMFLLSSSYDFFGSYLIIEGLSLTLYILACLLHQGIISVEAAIKYFSLGAVASGNLLLGIVIIFGLVGSIDFLAIQNFLGSDLLISSIFEIKISLTLIFFAFFFKISAFPCHVWLADVYEGV
jgi:NADH-quinone oxidoreductase subunit N